jgi:hypothetical protein
MQGFKIKAGFSKVDITPQLGVCLAGYFRKREATGILDPLYASALAVTDGNKNCVLISCDLIGIAEEHIDDAKRIMENKLGLELENVIISNTHTHLGPVTNIGRSNQKEPELFGVQDNTYIDMLVHKLSDAAEMALNNMKECNVELGYGKEDSISFIRRYKMKDGSIKTNPGVGNPDIIEPIGKVDPTVGVVSFRYTDGSGEVLVVNFGLHADIISGTSFSADYPGHMRNALKKQIPDCEVLYIGGSTGDVNHIDAMHPGKTGKGYEYSKKVGSILAAEVLKVYQKLEPIKFNESDVLSIRLGACTIKAPLRTINEEEIKQSKDLVEAFGSGKWITKGMSDTAKLASAFRVLELSNLGEWADIRVQALAIGDLVFVTFPGEIFTDIGIRIKESSCYSNTFVCALSNGYMGYFPTKSAFSEGGYEVLTSRFTDEMEDILVNGVTKFLKEL